MPKAFLVKSQSKPGTEDNYLYVTHTGSIKGEIFYHIILEDTVSRNISSKYRFLRAPFTDYFFAMICKNSVVSLT